MNVTDGRFVFVTGVLFLTLAITISAIADGEDEIKEAFTLHIYSNDISVFPVPQQLIITYTVSGIMYTEIRAYYRRASTCWKTLF